MLCWHIPDTATGIAEAPADMLSATLQGHPCAKAPDKGKGGLLESFVLLSGLGVCLSGRADSRFHAWCLPTWCLPTCCVAAWVVREGSVAAELGQKFSGCAKLCMER